MTSSFCWGVLLPYASAEGMPAAAAIACVTGEGVQGTEQEGANVRMSC
jgi:hypothetical protein